jgi:hypothetical protein
MVEYNLISTCRVCNSEALQPVVSLGKQKLVDFVDIPGESNKPSIPLEMIFCPHCKLVQLRHTTNPNLLYNEFWYRSGINEQMRSALLDIVIKAAHKAKVSDGDIVCDIGCNDGTMLDLYPKNVTTVGFDPSNQIDTDEARTRMTYAVKNYFNREDALRVTSKVGKRFKVITAIAMFYDIPDPAEFLNDVKLVLDDDGIIVIQMNYLLTMLQNNAFDNIVHEHLTYYSLTSLRWLFTKCGLDVIDVEENDVNGGSFRVYLKKLPIKKDDIKFGGFERVKAMLDKEKDAKLDQIKTYSDFGNRVINTLSILTRYIVELVANGNIVYGYGASTRGTVLLQATAVPLPLAGVAERDENKFGKYMISGWLKILPEDEVRSRCKYMLVLPWHFSESIINRERDWINNGGTLIFPLGGKDHGPYVVTKDGERSLKQMMEEKALATTK